MCVCPSTCSRASRRISRPLSKENTEVCISLFDQDRRTKHTHTYTYTHIVYRSPRGSHLVSPTAGETSQGQPFPMSPTTEETSQGMPFDVARCWRNVPAEAIWCHPLLEKRPRDSHSFQRCRPLLLGRNVPGTGTAIHFRDVAQKCYCRSVPETASHLRCRPLLREKRPTGKPFQMSPTIAETSQGHLFDIAHYKRRNVPQRQPFDENISPKGSVERDVPGEAISEVAH